MPAPPSSSSVRARRQRADDVVDLPVRPQEKTRVTCAVRASRSRIAGVQSGPRRPSRGGSSRRRQDRESGCGGWIGSTHRCSSNSPATTVTSSSAPTSKAHTVSPSASWKRRRPGMRTRARKRPSREMTSRTAGGAGRQEARTPGSTGRPCRRPVAPLPRRPPHGRPAADSPPPSSRSLPTRARSVPRPRAASSVEGGRG